MSSSRLYKRIFVSDFNVFLTFKNGKLHDYKGFPAVEYLITDTRTEKYASEMEHWYEGRRHSCKNYAIINKETALKIRNGKVDVFNRVYNQELQTFEVVSIKDFQRYVPSIEKTFHILNQIPLEKLNKVGITHREFIDSSEKGAVKIYYNGIQHSEIGPAELRNNGTFVYYKYGVKHCDFGPAIDDKLTDSKFWYYYGVLHNTEGPAFIRNKKGTHMTGFMRYGIMHNDKAPAFIKKHEHLTFTAWYRDGVYHRDNNHAVELVSDMHNIHEIFYYNNGQLHNLQGPAIISNINPKHSYYIRDTKYKRKEYKKTMKFVRKASYKLLLPLRRRLISTIEDSTNHIPLTFCHDVVKKICDFVY